MNSSIATSPAATPFTQNLKQQQQPQKQQTAKEAIAANVQLLIEQLEAGHSEALTAYLTAMGRFRRYSFFNILEIARQRPGATRVAGMYTWNQLGRRVKKGEKGIRILAPVIGVRRKKDKEEATRPEFKTCKYTTEAIVSEGIDKGEIRKVCTEPICPVHHPKPRSQKVADDPKAKAQQERQRREIAIADTTGIRTLAAIAEAVPVRLMKKDLLFIAERLVSLLDENRLSIVARRYGIKKAKDSDSPGKLFVAFLRRAEESVLGSVLVETTILYTSTRQNRLRCSPRPPPCTRWTPMPSHSR